MDASRRSLHAQDYQTDVRAVANRNFNQGLEATCDDYDDTTSEEDYNHDTSSASSRVSRSSVETDTFDRATKHVAVRSVEVPYENDKRRSYSTMTAFHLRNRSRGPESNTLENDVPRDTRPPLYESDTATKDVFEALRRLHKNESTSPAAQNGNDSGQVSMSGSDVFSAMPDDQDYAEEYQTLATEGRERFAQSRNYRRIISRQRSSSEQDRIFGQRSSGSQLSTPIKSPFRNSSSVRAIQLSAPSPNPFPIMPRSPRYDRGLSVSSSRQGTPSRRSQVFENHGRSPLAQHSNPQKEYPLVLLQCTISSIVLPYSDETLQKILPKTLQQDMILLSRKLTRNILERGVLIAHPGDDYELLEERVLESLELKAPRIAQCGHFLGSVTQEIDDGSVDGLFGPASARSSSSVAHCRCEDCGRHVANPMEDPPRWYVRVFAANGLMSSGAWAASWRQMERADLEIGIYVSDELRQSLEDEQLYFEERLLNSEFAQREAVINLNTVSSSQLLESEPEPKLEHEPEVVTATGQYPMPSSNDDYHQHRRHPSAQGPLPLSTLLLDYIKRRAGGTKTKSSQRGQSILLPGLIGVMFLLVASFLVIIPSPNPDANPTKWPENYSLPIPDLASASQMLDISSSVAEAAVSFPYPVCQFPSEMSSQHGMIALPEDIAKRVMATWGDDSTESSNQIYNIVEAVPGTFDDEKGILDTGVDAAEAVCGDEAATEDV